MKKTLFIVTLSALYLNNNYAQLPTNLPAHMYLAEVENKTNTGYRFAAVQPYGNELVSKLSSGAKAAENLAKAATIDWSRFVGTTGRYIPAGSPGTYTIDDDANWLEQFGFTDGRGTPIYNTLVLIPFPPGGSYYTDTCDPYIFIGPKDLQGYRAQGYRIAKSVGATNCCTDAQGNVCTKDTIMGWSDIQNFAPAGAFKPTKLKLTIDSNNPDPTKRIILEQLID